ncbi:DNA-binding response regulator [Aquimarina sp. AD10]|uniref:LytR/AlgR family response regulator transcription factor n=1 Tax=Aquimarina sp. AD10 TaxID=1714849 RepID=UPI000E534911|nr:response regulator transcription factor [Aquimarina sp. AD10]AXT59458.1 DNA-binding response regulator [Aquimarina sp. AD10]RKN00359.1 response regulator [Aquimarina sp. AD10]
MNKIKCIIVDDEPLAQDVISDYIGRLDFLAEVGRFDDALSAIKFLNNESVDLIFLDIQMPILDGINFLKALSHPPTVIFTTAHRHYAVDGFELNAVDYLVKPIPFYRFVQAIEKIKERTNTTTQLIEDTNAAFFKVENKKIKVHYIDILFIESLKDYIKVVLKDRSFVTYQTLSGVLALLPDTHFVQIHKSFVINYQYVNAIEGNMLTIEEHSIPIGRSYRENAMKKIYLTGKKGWR